MAVAITVIVILLFLQTLNFWTNHGDYLRVPDVKGKKLDEATLVSRETGL
jgi:beta-lactam-binding protein with PASTA domain